MSDEERQRWARKLDQVRDNISDLRGKVTFSDVVNKVSGAEAELPTLTSGLERLRARGYAFRGDLEQKLAEARDNARPVLQEIRDEIRRVENHLRGEMRDLSNDAGRITGDPVRSRGRIESVESRYDGVKREFNQIENRLEALARPLLSGVGEVRQKLKDLHWTMDQFDEASFKLRPEERPVAIAKATWEDCTRVDKPKGLLMLTDHRIYFEQKEERVTKRKFIFFTAESETLHKQLLDEPIGYLRSSDDETRGWVMKDQLLVFQWDREAKAPEKTTFELESGTAKDWDEVVELLRSGDLSTFEAETASSNASEVVGGAPPAGAAHQVKWPDKCTACGAALNAPVKGQTSIDCDYCGTSHAVEFVTA